MASERQWEGSLGRDVKGPLREFDWRKIQKQDRRYAVAAIVVKWLFIGAIAALAFWDRGPVR